MTPSERVHYEIGVVVANAQIFETVFTICAKLALKQHDVVELKDIAPLSASKSFKQPIASVLNELRSHVQLDAEFETKLESLVTRRHELVHRWFLTHGWPDPADGRAVNAILDHATQLSKDLNAMTRILYEAIVAWLDRFPEFRGTVDRRGADWRDALPPEFQSLNIIAPRIVTSE